MFLLSKLSAVVTFCILPIKANVTQPLLWHGGIRVRNTNKLKSNLLCCNTCRTEERSLLTIAHTLTCQQDKRTKCLGSCHSCCSSISISAVGRKKTSNSSKEKLAFYFFHLCNTFLVKHLSAYDQSISVSLLLL